MSAQQHDDDPMKIDKCPCCSNPWARATGDVFAMLCKVCEEEKKDDDDDDTAGFNRANMDNTVKPHDNFFRYANGGWMARNPIPDEYPSWNTFMQLHVNSQERLNSILKGLVGEEKSNEEVKGNDTPSESTPEEKAKLKAFYVASMDEETIENVGIEPLKPLLDLCEQTSKSTGTDLARNLGQFKSAYGISLFLGLGASPDNKNSEHSLCQIYQGGLGLPDRDYYFDEDKADKRDKYRTHVANMLFLLDHPTTASVEEMSSEDREKYDGMAEKVYGLEVKLAESHMTRTENRDPEATYNPTTVEDLTKVTGKNEFDFGTYLDAALGTTKSVEDLGQINVRNTGATTRVAEVLSNVDSDTLHLYLRWHAVRSCAKYMPKSFVNEDFEFNDKTLSGSKELKPRWKRAMDFIESALGEALGKLYCDLYFDASSKGKALDIVESVRQSLEGRLKEVSWMTSVDTRDAALKKMSRFKVKIGFPDKWIDYTDLDIKEGQPFLSMIFASRTFHHARTVKEMNAPTDRQKWFMTPQTVNAYYHPSLNEIVFPAAILQPPFFDPKADDAINYGAMGAVVGHEMTHGFDDKGRKFNFDGNMVDWWTKADGEEYERRVEVMVAQANAYDVHGQKVQGKLTCGENIADLGGLRLAMRALVARPGYDGSATVKGFTALQRLFIGWAQCWRQNITKERALQLVTLDPHGPNEMRCNGPLSNMPEFHEAFDVPKGTTMYKPVDQRVDIW